MKTEKKWLWFVAKEGSSAFVADISAINITGFQANYLAGGIKMGQPLHVFRTVQETE
ncbi:MAG: hypothetical protein Q9P01_10265 [Anaerolineae bacterium]|nr:hypothetical protein [Anaerolineae bacterium]